VYKPQAARLQREHEHSSGHVLGDRLHPAGLRAALRAAHGRRRGRRAAGAQRIWRDADPAVQPYESVHAVLQVNGAQERAQAHARAPRAAARHSTERARASRHDITSSGAATVVASVTAASSHASPGWCATRCPSRNAYVMLFSASTTRSVVIRSCARPKGC